MLSRLAGTDGPFNACCGPNVNSSIYILLYIYLLDKHFLFYPSQHGILDNSGPFWTAASTVRSLSLPFCSASSGMPPILPCASSSCSSAVLELPRTPRSSCMDGEALFQQRVPQRAQNSSHEVMRTLQATLGPNFQAQTMLSSSGRIQRRSCPALLPLLLFLQ